MHVPIYDVDDDDDVPIPRQTGHSIPPPHTSTSFKEGGGGLHRGREQERWSNRWGEEASREGRVVRQKNRGEKA